MCVPIYGSYNMDMRYLSDMYAQAQEPQARGRGHIHIPGKSQVPMLYIYTVIFVSWCVDGSKATTSAVLQIVCYPVNNAVMR